MAIGPFYLPRSFPPGFPDRAYPLVRIINGQRRFITDAHDCCCCPSAAECLIFASNNYWFDVITGDCQEGPPVVLCDGRYVLTRSPPPFSCRWVPWPAGTPCRAVLACSNIPPTTIPPEEIPYVPTWVLKVSQGTGPEGRCYYRKRMTVDDVWPDGVYTYFNPVFAGEINCTNCDATVTVHRGVP